MSYDFDQSSYRAQIENLAVGESFARAARFDGNAVGKDALAEVSRALRMAVQPTVHRVSKRTGQEYTIEAGEFRTASRDIITAIVVTRTA